MTGSTQRRFVWSPRLALAVLCGMLLLVPPAVWGLSQLRMHDEVREWLGSRNTHAQAFDWSRKNFNSDESILVGWEGSSLDDPRIGVLTEKLMGTPDDDGRRSGGLDEVSDVRTPEHLISKLTQSSGLSRAQAVARLQGLLVGAGTLRVRLTDEGRKHQEEIVAALQAHAATVFSFPLEFLPADEEPLSFVSPDGMSVAAIPDSSAPIDDAKPADETTAEAVPEPGEESPASPVTEPSEAMPVVLWAPHDFQVRGKGIKPHTEAFEQFLEMTRQLPVGSIPKDAVQECFFLPGSPVALSVGLNEAGLADPYAAIQKIKAAAIAAGIPETSLHLGGRAVANAMLNQEVMKAAWNPAAPWFRIQERSLVLLSGLVVAILAFVMLRSARLAILVFGLAVFTMFLGTALVPILGNWSHWRTLTSSTGQFNMVLVVMPTLLAVTALSSLVYLASYWQQAAAKDPRTATSSMFETAWSPCLWSSLVLALGLISLSVSSLQPVRDFGLYTVCGVIFAFFATVFGLPALLKWFPIAAPQNDDMEAIGWRWFGAVVARWKLPILATAGLLTVAACVGLKFFQTETKVIRHFTSRTRIAQDYAWIEQHLTGVAPVEIIVRFDKAAQEKVPFLQRAEKVREIQNGLRKLPEITGSISLADFLPSFPYPGDNAPPRKLRPYRAKSKVALEGIQQLPDARWFLTTSSEASQFSAAGDELWRINAQAAMVSSVPPATVIRQIDDVCGTVLRTVSGDTDERFREVGAHVDYHPGANHVVTGMLPLFKAAQDQLPISLRQSFLLGALLIAVALMIHLRSVPAGVIALIPGAIPVGIVFGLASWRGIVLDIGAVVTASLSLGIAVNGTLHLISCFRRELLNGKRRVLATVDALAQCGTPVWQAGTMIGLGLLALYPADLVLISRFGWLMGSLVFAGVISNLVLTPALLAGPLGWILERGMDVPQSVDTVISEHSAATAPPTHAGESRGPGKPHFTAGAPRIARID